MQSEQVAERAPLERLNRGGRDPEAVLELKRLLRHPVGIHARVAHTREPSRLDDVHATEPIAAEPALDVAVARVFVRPERRTRAIAWEPVARKMPRVDRPNLAVTRQ